MNLSKKSKILIFSAVAVVIAAFALFFVLRHHHRSDDGNSRKTEVSDDRQARKEVNAIADTLEVKVLRYDQDLFAMDRKQIPSELKRLTAKYPRFIDSTAWRNEMYVRQITDFLNDPYIQEIHKDVDKAFPTLDSVEEQLKKALSIYKHYFPEAQLPVFYGVVAGIDPSAPFVLYVDNEIIINMDWYLGRDYKYYKDYRIPQYIRAQCDRKYISLDCFRRALAYRHLPPKTPVTLLDYMIEEGKIVYFTELMFPETPVADVIGYSDEHFAWAQKYQADVWNYLIENDLLFSKDEDPIRRLVQEAPFSNPFKNSPGRIGAFIGWRIIVQYMEKHPEISLNQLMQETNSRTILDKSGYKPLK